MADRKLVPDDDERAEAVTRSLAKEVDPVVDGGCDREDRGERGAVQGGDEGGSVETGHPGVDLVEGDDEEEGEDDLDAGSATRVGVPGRDRGSSVVVDGRPGGRAGRVFGRAKRVGPGRGHDAYGNRSNA